VPVPQTQASVPRRKPHGPRHARREFAELRALARYEAILPWVVYSIWFFTRARIFVRKFHAHLHDTLVSYTCRAHPFSVNSVGLVGPILLRLFPFSVFFLYYRKKISGLWISRAARSQRGSSRLQRASPSANSRPWRLRGSTPYGRHPRRKPHGPRHARREFAFELRALTR
jgi:hypothetical protein